MMTVERDEKQDGVAWAIANTIWTVAACEDDQGMLNVYDDSEYAVDNCFTFMVDEEGGRFLIDFDCDDYFYNQKLSIPLAAFQQWLDAQRQKGGR